MTMPKMTILLPAALSALVAAGAQSRAALPPVTHADTEVATNVPFTAALDVSGRFAFTLSCRATPSNNVEIAFGTDANSNGVLDPEETDRVVGWDSGAWFTRKGADGAYDAASADSTDEIRTLSWSLQVGADGTASNLSATADGTPVFADLPLESTYSPSWNLLRLTGRGLDAALETFTISATPDATVFIMR